MPSVSWRVSPDSVSWTKIARSWLSSRRAYASQRESGDQTGLPWLPKTLKSGRCGSVVVTPGLTGAR